MYLTQTLWIRSGQILPHLWGLMSLFCLATRKLLSSLCCFLTPWDNESKIMGVMGVWFVLLWFFFVLFGLQRFWLVQWVFLFVVLFFSFGRCASSSLLKYFCTFWFMLNLSWIRTECTGFLTDCWFLVTFDNFVRAFGKVILNSNCLTISCDSYQRFKAGVST